MSFNDIPGLFDARLKFYEAGADLHNRLGVASEGYQQSDMLDEATFYASQTRALLMLEPELEAAKETAKGPLSDAVWDEIQRRSELTRHQAVEETGARTRARRDRQIRVEAIRGVRREGAER